MSIIQQNKLREAFVTWRASFNEGFSSEPLWYQTVAQMFPTDTEITRFWWGEDLGEMEEWYGAMANAVTAGRTFDVTSKPWKKFYEVDAFDLRWDRIGIYAQKARALGVTAALWPQTMVKKLLLAGDSTLCFDGQPFFDDSHPVNLENASLGYNKNLFESSPFNATNWNLVSKTMKTYKNPSGRTAGIRPTHVLCAPDIETSVRQFFNTTIVATADGINAATGSSENVHRGECIPVMIPELPDGTWIPCDMSKPIKPFGYVAPIMPEFIAQDDPNQPRYFENHQYAFGIVAHGQAFPTLPFLAALCRP